MEDGIEQYMPLLPKIIKPVTTIVTPTAIKQEHKTEKLILVDHNPSTMLRMTTDYSQETSACKQAYVSLHLNKWMLDNRYAVEYDGGTKKAPKSWIKFQKTGSKI